MQGSELALGQHYILKDRISISAYCVFCGKHMQLSTSLQKFCSETCRTSFKQSISDLRRRKRNEYQRNFRKERYKTEVKHMEKAKCPKCKQIGYLVRYTVKNKNNHNVVSIYETMRHQITQGGRSILKGQCYIRSVPLTEGSSAVQEGEISPSISAMNNSHF